MFRTKFLFIVLNLLAIGHYSEQLDCMNNGNNDNEDECMKRYKICLFFFVNLKNSNNLQLILRLSLSQLASHIQTNDQSNQNNNHNMIRMANQKEIEKLWPIIELYRRKLFGSKRNVNRNFQTQGW